MIKVTTTMHKLPSPACTDFEAEANEVIVHDDGASIYVDKEMLMVKNDKMDTIAIYAAGEWSRAVKA